MEVPFRPSERSSLGVEVELALVDVVASLRAELREDHPGATTP